MTCIPLHKTWQMNLLWPMDPQHQSRDALNTSTQNLADEPTLADGPPWYQSRDALNTSTQYFADELTLPNGPPQGNRAEMPLHCYWHLAGQECNFTLVLTYSGQEWQFHIATDILVVKNAISHCYWHSVSRIAISHCYWDLVVKNCNFTLLQSSSGPEWQFHIATDN